MATRRRVSRMVTSSRWFSRASVERVGGSVEVALGESGHIGALGEVLAEQTVGVLFRAPLPRRLRVTEVDLDAGVDRELACWAISLP